MAIKKHDFLELDFTAKVADTGMIFDLTEETVAKEHNLYDKKMSYKPIKICLGEHHVVKGLEQFLEGKELGNYTVTIKTEEAFGKKNPKLMRLMPLKAFHQQQIQPQPGLQINMDGMLGTVRTVSGGRVIMDFNHPLAGKDVIYEVKLKRIIITAEEKAATLFGYILPGIPFTVKEETLTLAIEPPEAVRKALTEKIIGIIPEIKQLAFKKPEEKKTNTLTPAPKVPKA
ncbi:MAG: peptidylprolyl isomerase [Nanoarchaeota archaeon]|nr:peptidylprolyl isomerase [Nanoarchaeota archaeon]